VQHPEVGEAVKTTAAVARDHDRDLTIESVDIDAPRGDEILVRIAGVGLCHTDLVFKSALSFPLPAVFGHEGSGTVQSVGSDVTKVKPGDRVVITFRSCGQCDRCRTGSPAYCRSMPALNFAGKRVDGSTALRAGGESVGSNFFGQSSFAAHCLTYERNVVQVPDDLPLELMGPLACGVQTGVGGIVRSLACEAGSSILILGAGAVGLSAVMGAVIQGCAKIVVAEPLESRRALAAELGATHTLDPLAATDLAGAVHAILPQGVDYAFDTTGKTSVLQATVACLGSRGVLGVVGVCPPGTPIPGDLLQLITFGHTIKGIIEGDSDPDEFIPQLFNFYRQGRLPLERLIRTYPLREINRAIADQHDGACVKAVLLAPQAA
jgi:aryl-alcohol dehydrogenase